MSDPADAPELEVGESRWGWLASRFVVVPAVLAVAIILWNVYVAAHDDGLVEGRVVGPDGAPVAGADVVLLQQNVTTFTEATRTRTDEDGSFTITDNPTHHAEVYAEKAGVGRSPRRTLRLWFKSQNMVLAEPLQLEPVGGAS
jgi:hypothetical protein